MKITSTLSLFATIAPASGFVTIQQQQKTPTVALSATRRDVFDAAAVAFGLTVLPQVASAEPRPMYLTEPTDEFKANEAKAMEFKRAQLQLKKEFQAVMERFPTEPNDESVLVQDITDLQRLVVKTQGLPLGIKKEELFKVIRSKKAKGFWPTNVEIA